MASLSVAALASDTLACGNYRVILPLAYARAYGVNTRVFHKTTYADLSNFDIIIAQRQTNPAILKYLRRLKSDGKTIIAETDDALEAVHPSNPAAATYKKGSQALNNYRESIGLAHGLTVTTPELGANYAPLNRNIYVVPNCLDFGLRKWPGPHKFGDELSLGWTGSVSHFLDLSVIGPALAEVMRKYPHVRYTHFAHDSLLHYLVDNYKLPIDRIVHIPPVSFEEHPQLLPRIDIGLAPLANNAFNQAKSPLKVLEYSACGIPYVASKVAPYQRYADNGVDGFIAETTSEWVDRLSLLIEDTTRRKEMSEAAYTKAREGYDLGKNMHRWLEAWAAIKNASLSGDTGPAPIKARKAGRNDPCPCGSGTKYKKCCYPAFG